MGSAEQGVRQEAQAHLLSVEDRMAALDQVLGEDCVEEFERHREAALIELVRLKRVHRFQSIRY